jgi:hypothetical protein
MFAAISDADPRRAARAARQHVRTVGEVRLLSWEP